MNIPFMRAIFQITEVDATHKIVWIIDQSIGEERTVTNDAERVTEELNQLFPGFRIIARTTDGQWTELVHECGVFKSYRRVLDRPSGFD